LLLPMLEGWNGSAARAGTSLADSGFFSQEI